MVKVTRDIAVYHVGTFYHVRLRNADGTSLRARCNGMCKTWKTRPDDFRLPVKHGLRDCFYITPRNAHEWEITDDAWREVRRKVLCVKLGIDWNAPTPVLRDRAQDAGVDEATIEELFQMRVYKTVGGAIVKEVDSGGT